MYALNLTLDWTINDYVAVKSITSYRDVDSFFTRDFDQSPLAHSPSFIVFEFETFGQEFQVSGNLFEEKMRWLLGVFYFGHNEQERDLLVNNTIAGGMTINDVVSHVIDQDLPIGGIGTSGMGAHRGRDGFKEFSHAKAVYVQTDVNEIVSFFHPPYSEEMKGMMEEQISSG